MAKFCGNCGGKLEENATQCPWCGTPTESQATPSSQKKQVDPERKKKWERIIKLAITAVVVIVIAPSPECQYISAQYSARLLQ